MIPQHLAIIMDGNGRWAARNGRARKDGHLKGAENVGNITRFCASIGISCLTLYAFSTENWKRPKLEVDFLMRLLGKYLKDEEKSYLENDIKFDFIGDISPFNGSLQDEIYGLREKTRGNRGLTQVLALNYGSHDEISRSVVKVIRSLNKDSLSFDKNLVCRMIGENLDTSSFPPVDILVRTGGEFRLSNFLLWQASYAELFFTQTFWPDFSVDELKDIIGSFERRHRRYGGV